LKKFNSNAARSENSFLVTRALFLKETALGCTKVLIAQEYFGRYCSVVAPFQLRECDIATIEGRAIYCGAKFKKMENAYGRIGFAEKPEA